jgi:dihydrofolate reductase
VWSRTRSGRDDRATYLSDDVGPFVSTLKHSPGKNIWLVGGADLVAECVRDDVIDEWMICVHPIVLGQGIPLCRTPLPARSLRRTRVERFSSGLVGLSYVRAPKPAGEAGM